MVPSSHGSLLVNMIQHSLYSASRKELGQACERPAGNRWHTSRQVGPHFPLVS